MRKLRSSEIKWFAKDYKTGNWQIQDLNLHRLDPDQALLTTAIYKVPRGHIWPLMKIFLLLGLILPGLSVSLAEETDLLLDERLQS